MKNKHRRSQTPPEKSALRRTWKLKKRVLYRAGALAVAAAVLAAGSGSAAASESVREAEQKKQQLESELKSAQKLIEELQKDQGTIEKSVSKLDRKLTGIETRMTDLEQQLEEKSKEIRSTEKELKAARKDEKKQYEEMRLRIRYLYENSGMSILEALLSSDSFAEFLNQAEYFSQIVSYDREMLEKYQQTRELIENSDQILKQDRADLETMRGQLEDEQQAVDLLLTEKEKQLSEVQEGLDTAQSEAEQYEAKIAAENQVIREIRAAEEQARREEEQRKAAERAARKAAGEKAAQEAAAEAAKEEQRVTENQNSGQEPDGAASGEETQSSGGGEQTGGEPQEDSSVNINTDKTYTGGTFAWPCPSSSRITSGYGSRTSPTEGASTNHRGIDIGASYGAAIVAAADGVVTVAGYSSGNGNYVTVSHGGGLYTVYCHCSSLAVSAGQKVSRGQTIAAIGSTGISTGNHLHFAVLLNGQYVNPMNYL